ncbi:NACHT domain-containing NTPase [Streptomyces sp. CMSTAAHL-2]|uniref:NACHT domain-containing protein n=1 Tax=Streptomyces sp. CMSTAAHL-2 TaxID=2904522 RepID=UPI001E5C1592|nr:NACHT domain-containing protein [Streptomyces sp. CMSTAAHL-2]MCE3031574.1 NACHT domain-containing protein [Streptomyces sp. CMSTAAHL-2]
MEPTVLGGRLASAAIGPLVRKLLAADGPGAGLVDRPVRLSALVSFRGEKRTLGEKDVRRLAERIVAEAVDSPGAAPFPAEEQFAVVGALARRLLALGDLEMDDVQAVRLGHRELARELLRCAGAPDGLSADACHFLDSATQWCCLQILEFFTRRSSFVARTLVEQSRAQAELIAKVDELIVRVPRPDARDTAFERRYLPYVAEHHNHITIYGIDLRESPDRWPLEVAYLSLEATAVEDAPPDPVPGERPVTGTGRLRAEEALLADSRVLLRGDAGSGKTTLVQWLAVTAAREGGRVPYVLPLRTLTRTGSLPAPDGFLTAVSCPLTPPEGWTERVLAAGRGLILVDGLDEIPAADRHRTRNWLRSLLTAHPGNHWLLTSRPTAVRPDWLAQEGFRELTLAPMRRSEVATFVHRWHEAARAPEFEAPLLDSLRTKRDLARLTTNPLMCGLICALHRERRGYLPTGRKELYDAALTMLLARRDRERGMGVDLGEEVQLELLQRLAYALVLSGRTEMGLDTAEGIVARCLPTVASAGGDAAAVLRELLLRSGLLRQPAEGVVDFVHRTFQDYLGARYAVAEGHLDVLLSHADDTQWEDVIRMAVAHARPRERTSLLRQLLARDTPRLTLLALACLEHVAALDAGVRAEVEARAAALIPPRTKDDARALAEAGPLVLELLPGPEGLTDAEALGVTITASLLGETEPEGALGVLRRFRGHTDFDVREQLISVWGKFDAEVYASEVLNHLDQSRLRLICASPEQRAALTVMRAWRWLAFVGAHRVEDIRAALPWPEAVTSIALKDNPVLTDLGTLVPFRELQQLWVDDCPAPAGLDRLSVLPLTLLGWSGGGDLTGLRSLRKLTTISVSQRLPGTDLAQALPVEAPLSFLFLGRFSTDTTGFRGLRNWPGLHTLSLGPLTTEPTAADWREVAELPGLAHLYVNGSIVREFPHSLDLMPVLPGIAMLRVPMMLGTEDLSTLASRLPGLRSVTLGSRTGHSLTASRYKELFPNARLTVEEN